MRIFYLFFLINLLSACTPHYMPMGPEILQPHINGDKFLTSDGVELPLTVWGPRKEADKIIIAAHSFGEFREAYSLIGEYFSKNNIAVWAFDQRGFGDSPHSGFWSSTSTMINDFIDFVSSVRNFYEPQTPLILLGESMGGAVVLGAISKGLKTKASAVILSGPGVRENRPNRFWTTSGLWLANRLIPGYEANIKRNYDPDLDTFHAQRWFTDPKIIDKVRLDTYFGLIKLSDFASDNALDNGIPTLVLFGTNDTQIHPKSICALMKRLGSSGTLRVFEGKPHLMFQTKKQKEMLSLMSEWIDQERNNFFTDAVSFCNN